MNYLLIGNTKSRSSPLGLVWEKEIPLKTLNHHAVNNLTTRQHYVRILYYTGILNYVKHFYSLF
jgi:hypothetical protein